MAKIYSAFPGTGKSWFFKNNKNTVLDSDSSNFDKKNFPQNYMKHIKQNINKVDIIFVSSHKEVREALVKNNIKFYLVYPEKKLKQEYINRYIDRNNNKEFVNLLNIKWDEWTECLRGQKSCKHIELKKNQFISDVIN